MAENFYNSISRAEANSQDPEVISINEVSYVNVFDEHGDPKKIRPTNFLGQNVEGTQYTLEQSDNCAFDRINVGAAERYHAAMGGWMLYKHTDGKVYRAKLNGDWSSFVDGTKVTEQMEATFETMIKCPPCYFKGEGKTMHFGGLTPIDGGETFDQAPYVGAYLMYVDGNGKGHSRPGVSPSHSKTMETFQQHGINTFGEQGGQAGFRFFCFINALYQARYGNLNSQVTIGPGFQHSNWEACRNVPMGLTKALGDGSGKVLYNDATIGNQYPVKLFGFEDLWGKIWEFRTGIRYYMDGSQRHAVIYGDHLCSNTAEGRDVAIPLLNAGGSYVRSMLLDKHWDMIPTVVGGDDSHRYADGYWDASGGQLLYVGAVASSGSRCGLAFSFSSDGFSPSRPDIGARLAFYGEATEVSGKELAAMAGL